MFVGWPKKGNFNYKLTTSRLLLKLRHIPNLWIQDTNYHRFILYKIKPRKERGFSFGEEERERTLSDESENPPATNDPSLDIDEQVKLG